MSPGIWMEIPPQERAYLAQALNVPRSDGALVVGGYVASDGYTQEDLDCITIERLQEYIGGVFGKNVTFINLLELAIQRIHAENKEKFPSAVDGGTDSPKDEDTSSGTRHDGASEEDVRLPSEQSEHDSGSDSATASSTVSAQPKVGRKTKKNTHKGTGDKA